MARAELREDFERLEGDLLQTFMAGCRGAYPQSHSDVQGGLRALLKRFEIAPRAIPLDWADLFKEFKEGQ